MSKNNKNINQEDIDPINLNPIDDEYSEVDKAAEGRLVAALRHKNVILPNFITILGLLSGVYAILLCITATQAAAIMPLDDLGMLDAFTNDNIVPSHNKNFLYAAYFLILAAVFDGLDGKVARLVRGNSDFGVQLDSLCDLVSFGVAPAILIYEWLLKDFGRIGTMAVFLFVAAGALRLARFNVQSGKVDSTYFVGLPIPTSAMFVAASVIFIDKTNLNIDYATLSIFFLVSIYILAFLMVSTVPFYSFKKIPYLKEHPYRVLSFTVLAISLMIVFYEFAFFGFILIYIVVGIILYIIYSLMRLFGFKKRN